jgi:hypothetical protein
MSTSIMMTRSTASWAAAVAAVLLAATGAVGILAVGDIADHASGAGRLSEGLAAAAFAAAAVTFGSLRPRDGIARHVFSAAAVTTGLTGLAMAGVAVTGQEPPEPWVTFLVLATLASLVAAGVAGWRARTWTWWVGAAIALFLPVMYVVPAPVNVVVMALTWMAVAFYAPRAG